MYELKPGSEPPLESGQYVIERVGVEPRLYVVDVSGGCVWVNEFGFATINRWNRMGIICYRRIDFAEYLKEFPHAQ